jgi:hypothetical protein
MHGHLEGVERTPGKGSLNKMPPKAPIVFAIQKRSMMQIK